MLGGTWDSPYYDIADDKATGGHLFLRQKKQEKNF